MSNITVGALAPTMSSLDLVDFINTDRREQVKCGAAEKYVELAHRSFMAKVPEVLGFGSAKFLADYQHPQNGQTYQMYVFPKREACLMAMSYSYELQAKVFDQMTALEAAAAPKLPQTFAQALRLAAEQADTIEAQALQLEAAQPKVEFVDRYVESTGLKGFRQVCKLLGAKENQFRDFLTDKKIMYRLGSEWVPHAAHLDTGRFEVKAGTADSGHAFNSARFTAKGVNWVAGQWAIYQLEQKGAAS